MADAVAQCPGAPRSLLRWLLERCLLAVATLLGISLLTFLVIDLAPLDRAALEVASQNAQGALTEPQARAQALQQLRIRYGFVDAATQAPVPVLVRFGHWLARAVRLDLAGPGEDPRLFWRRLRSALPVTLLLGGLSLALALGLGVLLGVWLGMRAGSRIDRGVTMLLFVALGLPEVLIATLLLLLFGSASLGWLPTAGLRSDGAKELPALTRFIDLVWHLILPVTVMAIGPLLLVARFLRESVARAAASRPALNLRVLGLEPHLQRRRLLRLGFAPLATLCGSLLPLLVGGSIVVETVFSIEGVGRLAFNAVRIKDQAMVMTITLLVSIVTLGALMLSDLLHRLADSRVRLAA
jgi:peptide/nickel transport system permease protein